MKNKQIYIKMRNGDQLVEMGTHWVITDKWVKIQEYEDGSYSDNYSYNVVAMFNADEVYGISFKDLWHDRL